MNVRFSLFSPWDIYRFERERTNHKKGALLSFLCMRDRQSSVPSALLPWRFKSLALVGQIIEGWRGVVEGENRCVL